MAPEVVDRGHRGQHVVAGGGLEQPGQAEHHRRGGGRPAQHPAPAGGRPDGQGPHGQERQDQHGREGEHGGQPEQDPAGRRPPEGAPLQAPVGGQGGPGQHRRPHGVGRGGHVQDGHRGQGPADDRDPLPLLAELVAGQAGRDQQPQAAGGHGGQGGRVQPAPDPVDQHVEHGRERRVLGGEVGQGRHPGRELAEEGRDRPDLADRPRVLPHEGQRRRPRGRPAGQGGHGQGQDGQRDQRPGQPQAPRHALGAGQGDQGGRRGQGHRQGDQGRPEVEAGLPEQVRGPAVVPGPARHRERHAAEVAHAQGAGQPDRDQAAGGDRGRRQDRPAAGGPFAGWAREPGEHLHGMPERTSRTAGFGLGCALDVGQELLADLGRALDRGAVAAALEHQLAHRPAAGR